jgi:hypothetical protein
LDVGGLDVEGLIQLLERQQTALIERCDELDQLHDAYDVVSDEKEYGTPSLLPNAVLRFHFFLRTARRLACSAS